MTLEEMKRHFPDADGETLEMAQGLLRTFDVLIPIRCQGLELHLPSRNSLWRGLQFWGMVTGRLTIDFSKFCLAGNCKQCALILQRPGAGSETVLACQTEPEAGMEILKLAEGFKLKG